MQQDNKATMRKTIKALRSSGTHSSIRDTLVGTLMQKFGSKKQIGIVFGEKAQVDHLIRSLFCYV